VHFLAADDPATDWNSYDIPSAPQKTPVVALIGYHVFEKRPFFFGQYWEPAPSDDELAALKSSPVRERIGKASARSFALLLHMPHAGDEGTQTHAMLSRVAHEWEREAELPVEVVTIDRTAVEEGLLAGFVEATPDGPEWVGVVFGRGKLMMPPLVGDGISEVGLQEHFDILMADCTCSRSARSMGVDIPMAWTDEMEAAFVPMLEDPDAASTQQAAASQPVGEAGLPEVPEMQMVPTLLLTLGGLAILIVVVLLAMVVRRSAIPR
jgi:hypothetical protein